MQASNLLLQIKGKTQGTWCLDLVIKEGMHVTLPEFLHPVIGRAHMLLHLCCDIREGFSLARGSSGVFNNASDEIASKRVSGVFLG